MMGIRVLATGSCLPTRVVTNDDMSRIVDTSDEWITKRTGIKERRRCTTESHLDLSRAAAEQALTRAGIDRSLVGACVVATVAADFLTPSCGALLQKALGLPEETPCFDVNAACAGFLYALRAAQGMLTPERPYGVVVGCERLTKITDYTDRSTCVLFGDGAGAVVVEASADAPDLYADLGARTDPEDLYIPGAWDERPSYIHMAGTPVFKFAVDIVPKSITRVLGRAGLTMDQVDWVVLHQANERIIDHVVKKMEIPSEKVFKNIEQYGNMSAACIPVGLDDLYTSGKLRPGMRALCVGFGGGLTWGGGLITIGGIQ